MKVIFSASNWGTISGRQIGALTIANLKTRYRKTVAGFLWVLMNPVMHFGIQSLIFSHVLNINVSRYPIFLLSALLPWIFISQNLDMCSGIFVASGRLLKSFSVHPLVYLLAQILDNVVNFITSLLVIMIFCLPYLKNPITLLLLPIPIASLFLGATGLAWLAATAQVFFRDTKFLITFFLQILYFITPIFYPSELLPPQLAWLKVVNPIYLLIKPFRTIIYNETLNGLARECLVAFGTAGIILALAATLWKWKKNEIYFHL